MKKIKFVKESVFLINGETVTYRNIYCNGKVVGHFNENDNVAMLVGMTTFKCNSMDGLISEVINYFNNKK